MGSLPGELILKKLRPAYWFSAHLHVKYAALFAHHSPFDSSEPVANPDEIMIEDSDDDVEERVQKEEPGKEEKMDVQMDEDPLANVVTSDNRPTHTRFLALDKILPGRPFLQILDFPSSPDSPKELTFDEEWLAIVKATAEYLSQSHTQRVMPSDSELESKVKECRLWVQDRVSSDPEKMRLPPFCMTAPVDDPTTTERPPCTVLFFAVRVFLPRLHLMRDIDCKQSQRISIHKQCISAAFCRSQILLIRMARSSSIRLHQRRPALHQRRPLNLVRGYKVAVP